MKIILVGAAGRMGKEVAAACERSGVEIVAAVDRQEGYIPDISDFCGKADAIVDFSSPPATESVLCYALKTKTPVVIAATGHTARQRKAIKAAGRRIPVFYSANLSLGIAVLIGCVKNALKVFPSAQIEIVEAHHAKKSDSPSGTALFIAGKISDKKAIYARRKKRTDGELGISSLRYGNVFGIHKVILYSDGQTLTFTHEAESRAVFADGAIKAAQYIINKSSGIYDIFSLINET